MTRVIVERLFWELLAGIRITPGTLAKIIGKSCLTNEQKTLLELMRRDNLASRSPFRATEYWIRQSRIIEDLFHWEGIDQVETQRLNQFFSGPQPTDPKLFRYASWLLYQNIKARDTLGLLSKISTTVDPSTGLAFQFDGNLVSWDLLISLDTLYSIYEVNEAFITEPVVVVDLGAGWGRIGYVLKLANPQCAYIICDLPEILLVSSTYLPRLLPHETIHPYVQNHNVKEFSRDMLLRRGG